MAPRETDVSLGLAMPGEPAPVITKDDFEPEVVMSVRIMPTPSDHPRPGTSGETDPTVDRFIEDVLACAAKLDKQSEQIEKLQQKLQDVKDDVQDEPASLTPTCQMMWMESLSPPRQERRRIRHSIRRHLTHSPRMRLAPMILTT